MWRSTISGVDGRLNQVDQGAIAVNTKGQLETQISEAIIKFEQDHMGRGPEETKTYLIDDMVLVRLKGVLTPAEKHLAKADRGMDGTRLIKEVRVALIEKARPLLETLVREITRVEVKSLHTDISTVSGERVIIFILAAVPEFHSSS